MFSTRVTNAFEPQRRGRGDRRVTDVYAIHRRAVPGRADLALLDAGVLQRFLERFRQQMLGAAIPALAELRAAHADDRDLVLDARSH
jgi:hypothetical protein